MTAIVAALALVALAAPAADAGKPVVERSPTPSADLMLPIAPQPLDPMEPVDPIYCICLPPID